jgi:hypothetical protein
MSSPRTYIIRGLDLSTNFNCLGLLEDQPGYVEITDVPTEAKAIELMLTNGALSKMTSGLPPVKSNSFVDVLNVKVKVFANGTGEAKKLRKAMAASIKTWAEKSRVRGVRGWRAHALKTPKIQHTKGVLGQSHGYELDFDAILGHAVFYTDKTLSVGHTDDASFASETINDLKKHLARQHPGVIGDVTASHAAMNFEVTAV